MFLRSIIFDISLYPYHTEYNIWLSNSCLMNIECVLHFQGNKIRIELYIGARRTMLLRDTCNCRIASVHATFIRYIMEALF